MESQFLIYGLVDPRINKIRYVGKSCNGMRRPKQHRHQLSGKTYRANWLKELFASGNSYSIKVIEYCKSNEDALNAEVRWIAFGRAQGWPLTNLAAGGTGVPGHHPSEETRRKRSIALRGRVRTAEHCAHISEAKKGKPLSALAHSRCREIMTGRIVSEQTRAKLRALHLGKKRTPEQCERIAAARRGKKLTAEHRAKIAAAGIGRPGTMKGRKQSAETRAKISAAMKARIMSPEHKAKIGIATRLRGGMSAEARTKAAATRLKRHGY